MADNISGATHVILRQKIAENRGQTMVYVIKTGFCSTSQALQRMLPSRETCFYYVNTPYPLCTRNMEKTGNWNNKRIETET